MNTVTPDLLMKMCSLAWIHREAAYFYIRINEKLIEPLAVAAGAPNWVI